MMTYPYYPPALPPGELPPGRRALEDTDPAGYVPDAKLQDAVNVALLLGLPLLLTGEPGTGKTQLAYHLAHVFGLGKPIKFETKSTSTARDLFYSYNTLARFQAAQLKQGSQRGADYISYNALGAAILLANPLEKVREWLPPEFVHGGQRRSVVLLDEIDKAPRDFPNDILNEIEHLYFRVAELDGSPSFAITEDNRQLAPILILTSNSEKNLPDAFLRRCAYYHIPFPDRARLRAIVEQRLGGAAQVDAALDLFEALRAGHLDKAPATAELLNWLRVLQEAYPADRHPLRPQPDSAQALNALESSLSVLVKKQPDRAAALQIIETWLKRRGG